MPHPSTARRSHLDGTTLRQQRSRGRDLFDLWLVLTTTAPDAGRIVEALRHYMRAEMFTCPQQAANLAEKRQDPSFDADLRDLVRRTPEGYEPGAAADLILERIGRHLPNAPASN